MDRPQSSHAKRLTSVSQFQLARRLLHSCIVEGAEGAEAWTVSDFFNNADVFYGTSLWSPPDDRRGGGRRRLCHSLLDRHHGARLVLQKVWFPRN